MKDSSHIMEFSSRWFITCAVLVCSCSVHSVLSVDHQHGFPIRIKELTDLRGASEPSFKQGATRDTVECEDNHVYNGSMCVCSEGLNGTGCRFSIDYTPVTVKQRVEVEAVLNHEYQDNFNNTGSPQYKEFVQRFITVMEDHYREPVGNVSVTVTAISKGQELPAAPPAVKLSREGAKSLNCGVSYENTGNVSVLDVPEYVLDTPKPGFSVNITYEVIIPGPNDKTFDSTYGVNAINNTNVELVNNSTGPYQFIGIPNCAAMDWVATDICKPDYSYLHYVETEDDRPHKCVTVCNPQHRNSTPCHNGGECRYHKEEGRICYCRSMTSTMYLNDDCELPIQAVGLFAGFSVMFLIILLIISALVVRVVTKRAKQVKKEDVKEKLVNQWTSDDVTRPSSTFFATEGSGNLTAPTYQMNRPISGDFSWEA